MYGKLWDKVMEKGRKQEKGIGNELLPDEVQTILATAHMLGVNENFVRQASWDLSTAKYKVYDWIGMLISGRNQGYGETPQELKSQKKFTKIVAHLYLVGSIEDLIADLRTADYQTESSYKMLMDRSKKKLGEVI